MTSRPALRLALAALAAALLVAGPSLAIADTATTPVINSDLFSVLDASAKKQTINLDLGLPATGTVEIVAKVKVGGKSGSCSSPLLTAPQGINSFTLKPCDAVKPVLKKLSKSKKTPVKVAVTYTATGSTPFTIHKTVRVAGTGK